jgi:hypothetical protein
MVVPNVGFFKKMTKMTATTSGAYTLAHCSTQGTACAENAVHAGKLAAAAALSQSARRKALLFQSNPLTVS